MLYDRPVSHQTSGRQAQFWLGILIIVKTGLINVRSQPNNFIVVNVVFVVSIIHP